MASLYVKHINAVLYAFLTRNGSKRGPRPLCALAHGAARGGFSYKS